MLNLGSPAAHLLTQEVPHVFPKCSLQCRYQEKTSRFNHGLRIQAATTRSSFSSWRPSFQVHGIVATPKATPTRNKVLHSNNSDGKWTRIEDIVPIKDGDMIYHCYVSLPEGNWKVNHHCPLTRPYEVIVFGGVGLIMDHS